MSVSAVEMLLLLIIAFIANGLSALAGGGAGLLQLPILLFLGLAFPTALATHKIASVALGVGATLRHIKETPLEWRFAAFILISGLPGVWLGAQLILSVPDALAKLSLGILTIGLGLYSWFKPNLGQAKQVLNRDALGLWVGGAVLFFIGVLNGSLTSGTGLFVTLWLVRWFGLDYARAVSYTLVLVDMFWNGLGAIALAMQAPVKWEWLPALVVGALVGGYVGTHYALNKGNGFIKRVFEILTVVVGSKLIFDAVMAF